MGIREAAATNLKKLIETFGVEWAKQSIVPQVLARANHPNYLYRMTTLQCITVMSQAGGPELITNSFLPILTRLGGDSVANIRFNVAKTLKVLCGLVDASTVQSKIKPVLLKLLEDSDKDVCYFASAALALANAPPGTAK